MSKSKHYKKTYKKQGEKTKWGLRILQVAVFGILLVPIIGFATFVYYARDLPRPEKFSEISLAEPTKIYDRTGNVLLFEVFGEEKHTVIPLSEIPQSFQSAVLAIEDDQFYKHSGISLKGTARAILINLGLRQSQFQRPGGSTITQQLARNSFLTTEKTIARKIRELILTIELERQYAKSEILEFYLNRIPFGSNAYGIAAGSELHFQKEPKDLTIAESAALAALIQAPTYYSPHGPNKNLLLARKDYALSRMTQEGFLTIEEMEAAKAEKLVFQDVSTTIRAPHFVLHTLDILVKKYGEDFIRERGLRVTTSLDWDLQQQAEVAVKEAAQTNALSAAHNAALVALDPQTGEILTMVGSKDWFGNSYPEDCSSGKDCLFDPKLNVATYSQGRQPGSAFKPFVYAAAFQRGATDKTTVVDEETNFGVWGGKEYIPQNYDGKFRGKVTLREALAQSLNIPAVKVLVDLAGIEESVALAKQLGITTLGDPSFYGPALVLGGGEVRLLDIVSAYGVFAAEGKKAPPVAILTIKDAEGNLLESNQNSSIQILSPEIARLITNILSDNEARAPLFGLTSPLHFNGYDVAAKTGTTNSYRDAWTIGYSPSIVVGVWSGNSDNTPTARQPGVMLSAPLWHRFMEQALAKLPKKDFSSLPQEQTATPL
jgi:membrane peptidoglycan carboxypeptidase